MLALAGQDNPLRYLTRMAYNDSPGWWLRLTASAAASGEPFEMHFADGLFGGFEGSLRAAQAQRDALEDRARKGCHIRVTAASASRNLPVGVRLVWRDRPSGPLVLWEALWTESAGNLRKRWSVTVHGYRGGFAKAIAQRAKMTGLDLSEWACPPIEILLSAGQLATLRAHPRKDVIFDGALDRSKNRSHGLL